MEERFAADVDWEIADSRHTGHRIGMLWANFDDGSGDATLTLEFSDQPALTRADVLKDIIGVLSREYDNTVQQMNTRGPLSV